MFRRNEIKKILFTLSIFFIGFLFLFYFETSFYPEKTKLESINYFSIDEIVFVKVTFIEQTLIEDKKILFGKVKDETGKINIIIFDIDKKFEKNKEYLLLGKVSIYNNELQIIVNKVIAHHK